MPDPRFFLTAAPMTAAEAARIAGAALRGSGDGLVRRVAGLDEHDVSDALVFAETAEAAKSLGDRAVGLCLATEKIATLLRAKGAVAVVASPKLGFAKVAARLHLERPIDPRGGHPSAKLGAGAVIHETAVVADGAEIGARCVIGPNAVIGPGVIVGDDCRIGPNAVVMHAIVGARVSLLSGAVVGEAGFGFVPGPEGPVRVPQLGRVVIGDDVEIGANSCVDRGALGDTAIGNGVKIDNLVQVGHNVRIGPMTLIASLSGISGSVEIGAGVLIGGQVGMADHIRIGDRAELAARAGLMRDVPAGERWAGAPAKPAKVWFREITALARLAERKKKNGDEQD